jgi:hypothetical protein
MVKPQSASKPPKSAPSPFVPHSNPTRPLSVTVDRQGRLCLSAELRRELECLDKHGQFYVSYDKVNKRIGIAKPSVVRLTDIRPYNFDMRGYTYARRFLSDNEIPHDTAYNYEYDGKENGWLAFRLVGYDAPDQPKE